MVEEMCQRVVSNFTKFSCVNSFQLASLFLLLKITFKFTFKFTYFTKSLAAVLGFSILDTIKFTHFLRSCDVEFVLIRMLVSFTSDYQAFAVYSRSGMSRVLDKDLCFELLMRLSCYIHQ